MNQDDNPTPRRRRTVPAVLAGCLLLFLLLLCAGGVLLLASRVGPRVLQNLQAEAPPAATAEATEESLDETPAAASDLAADDTTATDVTVEPAADPGRVNRISFIDPAGQVGTVAPDGSDARMLTDQDDRFFQFPAWSPDGQQVAAVGGDEGGSGIYIFADAAAVGSREIYYSSTESPFYLYWSPNSEQVSFLANHPGGIGLHVVAADGQSPSRLLDVGQPFYWNWAGDSERLFYHTGFAADDARLAFLDVTAGDSGENLARPGFFQVPGISHNGAYLAFAEVDAAGARWLVTQDSAGEQQQRTSHFGLAAMTWSPTLPQLAYISPEAPALDVFGETFFGPLRLLDGESGEEQILDAGLVLAFFWSPDGRSLAYLKLADPDGEVAQVEQGKEGRRTGRLAAQAEEEIRLQLYTVDVESGQSQLRLTFVPTPLYISQFLPFFDQYALSHQIWSPDSDAIVLPVQEGDKETIYVVPLVGNPQPVAEGSMAFWSSH